MVGSGGIMIRGGRVGAGRGGAYEEGRGGAYGEGLGVKEGFS